uniref:CTCK domain-containing protein n=1 Tax=Meloidogyne hapla TaxID=6305 RepID=A0A1I8BXF3_MELHA
MYAVNQTCTCQSRKHVPVNQTRCTCQSKNDVPVNQTMYAVNQKTMYAVNQTCTLSIKKRCTCQSNMYLSIKKLVKQHVLQEKPLHPGGKIKENVPKTPYTL